MKRSTAVLSGFFLLACLAVPGIPYWLQLREEAAGKEAKARQEAAAAAKAAKNAEQRAFEDHAMAQLVPKLYTRPVSEWQRNEKAFYQRMLSGGKFDVLVVPFQVGGWAFDRSTRSIMTAELAMGISQSQKVKVPDPFLVAKALGDGQRQLTKESIYQLADAVGAKRVVWGFAGHDKKGKMSITLLAQNHAGTARDGAAWGGPVTTKRFEGIAFGDEVPAIEAYEALLPEILKSVGVEAKSPVFGKTESRLEMEVLPPSPFGLAEAAGNPAQDAYGFLLYSALTPKYIGRTKEMFAEKAHLALLSLSVTSPEYRALRARTFMALGFRLAAIKALGKPQTAEDDELLAALNGNLPDVSEAAAREKNPLKQLLQRLDENTIGTSYGVLTEKQAAEDAAALKLPGRIWPFIVTRAFLDSQVWSQYNNAPLKTLLDYELPVKGYSLEDVARASESLADPGKIELAVALSVFNHGRRLIDANQGKWCCEFAFSKPGQLDYLELLQGIGHDNLIRRIGFLSGVQSLPAQALSFANSIDATYKGYPYYALARSKAESKLSELGGVAGKEALDQAVRDNAINALYWEQGQSPVGTAARDMVERSNRDVYGQFEDFYYADIPYRPDHWSSYGFGDAEARKANALAGTNNATWQIGIIERRIRVFRDHFPDGPEIPDILASMSGRFAGAPQRNSLLGRQALAQGDNKAAESYFRDNIKIAPTHWESYGALGRLLLDMGDAHAAAKVFHSYSGFQKGAGDGPVVTANHAYRAGSYLYNAGYLDLAKPFYQIAASQGSGAESEMNSDTRLKLLAGDVQGAMLGALRNAQRYQDAGSYRDYLGLLHASGQSGDAWTGFWVLVKESKSPEIWESAMVGHHKAELSEAQVVDWLRDNKKQSEGAASNAFAIYLVRFATTDRTPSGSLSQVIDQLDPPRWVSKVSPRAMYEDINLPGKTPVKSIHAYFVEAYRALKLKDFAAAKSIFDEASVPYDFAVSVYTPPYAGNSDYLPYYAYAAAKAGDTSGVEKIMSGFKYRDQGFDYYLSQAVLAGAAGKNDEALRFLERARCHRPDTGNRALLPQHTFAEIAGLIAEMTGSPKIWEVTLDWAKANEKFEPWQAWAYAMEAKMAKKAAERQRALAMAFYLDPKSEHLSAFGKPEIDAAVRVFGPSNPLPRLATKVPKKGDI